MSDSKEVTARASSETRPAEGEAELVLRPPVDIYEDDQGITLEADLPGVSKDRLDIHSDRDTLVIEGTARLEMPEDMEALYADVRSTRYRRSFSLGSELEADQIEANLKDGVLRLRIPKKAEVRPRKIEVKTD